jgi:diguanylate cyclase (GGDEF)-like protein/PAS domain S-box-containing protein
MVQSERPLAPGDWWAGFVESALDPICIHTLDGTILAVNRAFVEFLGYPRPESVVGRNLIEFFAAEARSGYQKYVEDLSVHKAAYGLVRIATRTGESRILEYRCTLWESPGGPPAVRAHGRDVTEARRFERSASRRAELDRAISTLAADFLLQDAARIDHSLQAALRLCGEFTAADESFLLVVADDDPGWEAFHCWSRTARSRNVEQASPESSAALLGWCRDRIRETGIVRFNSATTPRIPEPGRDPHTGLAVTQMVERSLRVLIGVESRGSAKWSDEISGLLTTVGRLAAGALARSRTERELRESARQGRLLFERSLAGVYRCNLEGRLLDCNGAYARILGFDSREAAIEASRAGPTGGLPDDRDSLMRRLRKSGSVTNWETYVRRQDGTPLSVLENISLLEDEQADGPVLEGTLIDISARKEAEAFAAYQAHHDPLTGLPNRVLMNDRLGMLLAQARRAGARPAVLFADVDRFKRINDSLGHEIGDDVLKAVAARFQTALREDDTVARVGGDEFVILLSGVRREEDAGRIARKLLKSLDEPLAVGERKIAVTVSIGVAVAPADGRSPAALLKSADDSMYRAKQMGRNTYQLTDPGSRRRAQERVTMERNLEKALVNEEFVVYYQPQVSLHTNLIVGFEALVRWHHPERGLVPPAEFIPVAEDSRLIVPLGEWVMETAARQARLWQESGFPELRAAVNLSPRQFEQPDLPSRVAEILRRAELAPELLELEITESVTMKARERTLAQFAELRNLGIRLSIDDFGTGQSSISYLKKFPIHSIKIDHSFVREIAVSPADRAIVKAVIAIAHGLNLRVVADGVETREQRRRLTDWACDEIQGYLVSRPLPAEGFTKTLESGPGATGAA